MYIQYIKIGWPQIVEKKGTVEEDIHFKNKQNLITYLIINSDIKLFLFWSS